MPNATGQPLTEPISYSDFASLSSLELSVVPPGKRVAVFCSSSATCPLPYFQAARQVGTLLSQNGCVLIYGGGSWGLMGELASGAAGAPIVGVIPELMVSTAGETPGQVVIVKGMAERKRVIDSLADVFVGLPGGFGTLDELTEMLTWNQIGVNNKLVILVNIDGFFDHWLKWCERAKSENFIREEHTKNFIVVNTPEEMVEAILLREPIKIPGKFRTKA